MSTQMISSPMACLLSPSPSLPYDQHRLARRRALGRGGAARRGARQACAARAAVGAGTDARALAPARGRRSGGRGGDDLEAAIRDGSVSWETRIRERPVLDAIKALRPMRCSAAPPRFSAPGV